MIISYKHKFIFVKTRKVAGSSIEKILYNYLGPNDICTGSPADGTPMLNCNKSVGHRPASWFIKNVPQDWKNLFTWTITRNPFDSLVSFYYFHRNNNKPLKVTSGTFDEFVLNADLKKFNDWYKYTKDGKVLVDKVFKYETLHEELSNQSIIPYNNELLNVFVKNETRQFREYKNLYSQEMIEKVEKEFNPVLEKFGYSL
jgi:hypothetical protein